MIDNIYGIKLNRIAKIAFYTSLTIILLHFVLHPVRLFGMYTSLFYMDEQLTLAALFTSAVAVLVGVLFLFVGLENEEKNKQWVYMLTGIFFFSLSLDEYFSIHEYLNGLLASSVEGTNLAMILNLSWVFPLLFIVLAVVGLLYYLIKMETNIAAKRSYILGLIAFILVLVFEIIGGNTYDSLVYIAFVGVEEGMEMLGLSFFLLGVSKKVKLEISQD